MAAKPFTKVSAEQRALFGQRFQKDGARLLKDLGLAAVNHLDNNPDSVIAQTLAEVEAGTGALTFISRGIQGIMQDRAAKAAAASGVKQKQPVDAEFVEEPKK